MNHHADFAALAEQRPEPDCAHYCGGQCDPWGTTCAKRHKPARKDEQDAGNEFALADAKLWRSMQRIGAAAGLGLLVFLIAKAMGVA